MKYDRWLEEKILQCRGYLRDNPRKVNYVMVEVEILLACMQDLQRFRELESRKIWKPKPSADGVCCCGGIPQTAADGTCFYCKGKVPR